MSTKIKDKLIKHSGKHALITIYANYSNVIKSLISKLLKSVFTNDKLIYIIIALI